MATRITKLASHIPGSAATVTSAWPSADRMALTVSTMGVEVPCTVHAEENLLRVTVHLPAMFGLMAAPISAMIRSQGERLMLDDNAAG